MKTATCSNVMGKVLKAERFGESADADLQKIGHRKPMPIKWGKPVREETGVSIPENVVAGNIVRIAAPNRAAICVLQKEDISIPIPVVAVT